MKTFLKISSLVMALSLMACSSTSNKNDDLADLSVRDQYVETTQKKIEVYREEIEDLDERNREIAKARIADVEAELRNFKNASYDSVDFHKKRIENNLDRIRSMVAQSE